MFPFGDDKRRKAQKGMVINMALLEDYLDAMDDLLDKAQAVPFSSKKCMIDAEQLRECIDQIRMHVPDEIKNAKNIVQDRKSLIDDAKKQAEEIVTRAEARASAMVENSEITKAAQAKAAEIEKNALIKARAVKNAADEYIIDVLTKTEETLAESLTAVKRTKGSIKMPRSTNPNIPQQNPNQPRQ